MDRALEPPNVSRAEIAAGLPLLGIRAGQVVLVHSAMRTLGRVEGGPTAGVEAFLDILGPGGTLVVPTFTFAHEIEAEPIIDPAFDRSEMGAITEALRLRADARRSTAYRHSFAVVGRRAEVITTVDPALSVFDPRASFGVMLALDTQVVLLGVTYSSSTSHHFAEYLCEVPYRHTAPVHVRVRRPDGSLMPLTMTDYQPRPSTDGSYYGSRGPDFNRLGRMLEKAGEASVTGIGNSILRRFAMRDLITLAGEEAARDFNIFRTADGRSHESTPLDHGRVVLSPPMVDGAGRPVRYEWAVADPARLGSSLRGDPGHR